MSFNRNIPSADFIEAIKSKIRSSNIDEVKELINQGNMNHYKFNFVDPKSKYTLLHFAITKANRHNEKDMLEIIKMLNENGCAINKAAEDSLKNTPIHSACRRGLESILDWLIEKGVDTNIKDATNQTPIDYLNKQINNAGRCRDKITQDRLIHCRNLLLNSRKNNVEKSYTIGRLGLFATIVVGGLITANSIAYRI